MTNNASTTVVVGLSGGVDSAVAALLLVQQGYTVHGLFMKNWEDDDSDTACTAEQDLNDAKQVAAELGIPLHQVNFSGEYRKQVFDHCLREFAAGRTPNPDVLCNREIKFRAFLEHALRLGADRVATGHYARIQAGGQGVQLHRGLDAGKDQTYFLYMVGQAALARTLFPVGELQKSEVRRLAEDAGFDNFEKKDSTGICFIGERDFQEFLSRYIQRKPGRIVSVQGRDLGQHQGLSFYTLGQRQGLGIGGVAGHGGNAERSSEPGQGGQGGQGGQDSQCGSGKPWYVVDKDLDGNRLIVAQGHDHPALLSTGLDAEQLHWNDPTAPPADGRYTAKVRYRQHDQACTLHWTGGDSLHLTFDDPQRAVTPGQSVVLYDGPRCLGGGIITRRRPLREMSENNRLIAHGEQP